MTTSLMPGKPGRRGQGRGMGGNSEDEGEACKGGELFRLGEG